MITTFAVPLTPSELLANLMLYWRTPVGDNVTMALQGRTNGGWLGVGWTGGAYRMAGTEAVVGHIAYDGLVAVDVYDLNGTVLDSIGPTPRIPLAHTAGEDVDGIATLVFTRPMSTGRNPIRLDGTTPIVGAIGIVGHLSKHSAYSAELVRS